MLSVRFCTLNLDLMFDVILLIFELENRKFSVPDLEIDFENDTLLELDPDLLDLCTDLDTENENELDSLRLLLETVFHKKKFNTFLLVFAVIIV